MTSLVVVLLVAIAVALPLTRISRRPDQTAWRLPVWSFVPVALLALVVAANVLVSKCLDIWEKVVENGGTPPPATSCWPGGAAGTGVIVGQSR